MIDEPRTALPDHEIGVARGAIGVCQECIEPHDTRGKIHRDQLARGRRVEVEGAVQIAKPDIDAVALAQDLADLRIGLAPAKRLRTCTSASDGTGRSSASATIPPMSSATSAFAPCPAPRNLTTNIPSSVSTTAGNEPPSRNGCTYRRAVRAGSEAVLGIGENIARRNYPARHPHECCIAMRPLRSGGEQNRPRRQLLPARRTAPSPRVADCSEVAEDRLPRLRTPPRAPQLVREFPLNPHGDRDWTQNNPRC